MSSLMVSEVRTLQRNGSAVKLNVAQRVVLMCASALFADLSESACEAIASCATAREFAHDELLFTEGQAARHLVLLQSGSAKVTQTSAGDSPRRRERRSGHDAPVFIRLPHLLGTGHGAMPSAGLGIQETFGTYC